MYPVEYFRDRCPLSFLRSLPANLTETRCSVDGLTGDVLERTFDNIEADRYHVRQTMVVVTDDTVSTPQVTWLVDGSAIGVAPAPPYEVRYKVPVAKENATLEAAAERLAGL